MEILNYILSFLGAFIIGIIIVLLVREILRYTYFQLIMVIWKGYIKKELKPKKLKYEWFNIKATLLYGFLIKIGVIK